MTFADELHQQRWDDHRLYHHNRINQALHLVSACCFLISYVLIFVNPVWAVMAAWPAAMVVRQIGHFFFEPKTYDAIAQASHETKERVKVGYNLKRKFVLLSLWALAPVALWLPHAPQRDFLHDLAIAWLMLGIAAVLFRMVQLFFVASVQTGVVWATKILTDPFHDIKIYHRAPLHIARGEMYDDMTQWYREVPGDDEEEPATA